MSVILSAGYFKGYAAGSVATDTAFLAGQMDTEYVAIFIIPILFLWIWQSFKAYIRRSKTNIVLKICFMNIYSTTCFGLQKSLLDG
jgi:hypothetical protein